MKRPYLASWNHSRRLAFAASCDPSTPISTAARLRSSLRVRLAPLASCSRQTSATAIGRRRLNTVRITGTLAADVRHEEWHVAAFRHHDANRRMRELDGIDLVELSPQRIGAPPHARVFVGRIRVRPAERFDADQVFVQRVAEAAQFHLADVAEEIADLRR